VKIWFDGGARPNPGALETAVVAGGRTWLRTDAGHGDSSDGEWLAAIAAMEIARDLGLPEVILLGDSAMVVGQAVGKRRVAARFAGHHARFRDLAAGFARVRVRHIGRKQNLAGIALERLHGRL